MESSPNAVAALSRKILRILVVTNIIYAMLLLGMFNATIFLRHIFVAALKVPSGPHQDSLVMGMRLVIIVGLAGAAVIYVILRRLIEIVDTVHAGDPFIMENATRLRKIAWALLAIELLHHVVGIIAASISTDAFPIDIGWEISPTRWIAVLLLFVLAGVFEQGARMRADLEGTV
jgi:hypothetical protein